jgi:hypothetical protein
MSKRLMSPPKLGSALFAQRPVLRRECLRGRSARHDGEREKAGIILGSKDPVISPADRKARYLSTVMPKENGPLTPVPTPGFDCNQRVGGSSPSASSNIFNDL